MKKNSHRTYAQYLNQKIEFNTQVSNAGNILTYEFKAVTRQIEAPLSSNQNNASSDNTNSIIGAAYLSKGGQRLFYTRKNYNFKFDFKGKKLVCRHLAYLYYFYRNGGYDHPTATSRLRCLFSRSKKYRHAGLHQRSTIFDLREKHGNYDEKFAEIEKKIPSLVFPSSWFGKALAFMALSLPPNQKKGFLFQTTNHAMHILLQHKTEPERYVVNFWDPNKSNIEIRAFVHKRTDLEYLLLSHFLNDWTINRYNMRNVIYFSEIEQPTTVFEHYIQIPGLHKAISDIAYKTARVKLEKTTELYRFTINAPRTLMWFVLNAPSDQHSLIIKALFSNHIQNSKKLIWALHIEYSMAAPFLNRLLDFITHDTCTQFFDGLCKHSYYFDTRYQNSLIGHISIHHPRLMTKIISGLNQVEIQSKFINALCKKIHALYLNKTEYTLTNILTSHQVPTSVLLNLLSYVDDDNRCAVVDILCQQIAQVRSRDLILPLYFIMQYRPQLFDTVLSLITTESLANKIIESLFDNINPEKINLLITVLKESSSCYHRFIQLITVNHNDKIINAFLKAGANGTVPLTVLAHQMPPLLTTLLRFINQNTIHALMQWSAMQSPSVFQQYISLASNHPCFDIAVGRLSNKTWTSQLSPVWLTHLDRHSLPTLLNRIAVADDHIKNDFIKSLCTPIKSPPHDGTALGWIAFALPQQLNMIFKLTPRSHRTMLIQAFCCGAPHPLQRPYWYSNNSVEHIRAFFNLVQIQHYTPVVKAICQNRFQPILLHSLLTKHNPAVLHQFIGFILPSSYLTVANALVHQTQGRESAIETIIKHFPQQFIQLCRVFNTNSNAQRLCLNRLFHSHSNLNRHCSPRLLHALRYTLLNNREGKILALQNNPAHIPFHNQVIHYILNHLDRPRNLTELLKGFLFLSAIDIEKQCLDVSLLSTFRSLLSSKQHWNLGQPHSMKLYNTLQQLQERKIESLIRYPTQENDQYPQPHHTAAHY